MRTALSMLVSLAVAGVTLGGSPRAWAAPADPPTVAALYFDYDGTDPDLRLLKKGLTSMLISDLAGLDTIRVVERGRLESVLAELKLQATPTIDRASAVKTGKHLGARFLVMGEYFYTLDTFRVDARIVDVQTAQILASFGGTGKPDGFLALEQKLAGELRAHFAKLVPPPATAQTGTPLRTGSAKPPARLKAKTVVEYGRALAAIDAGDKKAAEKSLKKVVAEAPDFSLASADLDRLMK